MAEDAALRDLRDDIVRLKTVVEGHTGDIRGLKDEIERTRARFEEVGRTAAEIQWDGKAMRKDVVELRGEVKALRQDLPGMVAQELVSTSNARIARWLTSTAGKAVAAVIVIATAVVSGYVLYKTGWKQ